MAHRDDPYLLPPSPTGKAKDLDLSASRPSYFKGPQGTRYLADKPKPVVKKSAKEASDSETTLWKPIVGSRKMPGCTYFIPRVASESLHGRSYGTTTEQLRHLVKGQSPYISNMKEAFVDFHQLHESEDAKEQFDAQFFVENIPREWSTTPDFDPVAAVHKASPTSKRLNYQWADPRTAPTLTVPQMKMLVRDKVLQRVPLNSGLTARAFSFFSGGSRYITFDRWCQALQKLGMFAIMTEENVISLYSEVDHDHDGLVQLFEFARYLLEESEEELRTMVDRRSIPLAV